jgi:FixJ family two-component response regulator
VTTAKPIVIVIDDDPSMLRALKRLLSGANFEVWSFDHPNVLLKSDLPKTLACLVVDIHLPEINGVALCNKLSAAGCTLPVILITAHSDEQTRTLAASIHPVALLTKPFGRDSLLSSIAIALKSEQTT